MKKLLAGLALIVLSGCAGSAPVNWAKARQIEKGMPQQRLTELMGQPYSVVAKTDGSQMWMWVHVNILTGSSTTLAIPVQDGVVAAVVPIPDSFH